MKSSPVTNTDVLVGRRLSTVRQVRGLSVDELAAKLNLAAPELTNAEAGLRRVGPSLLVSACRVLDVPIGYFFDACDILESGAVHSVSRRHGQAK
jgi:transcriptional regulator with XRE-family HTH domain